MVGAIVFALFGALAIAANSLCGMIVFLPLTLACIPLALLYGRTSINRWGITHSSPLGRHALAWDEMNAVVMDIGDNTIVFKGEGKQLVLPGLALWASPDKPAIRELMGQELKRRGIEISRGFAAFAISHGCRVKGPLDQREVAADQGDLPIQPHADAHQPAGAYKLANIRRLLVEGFSADELHRLVRYEPLLKIIDEEFRPGDDVPGMADTIIDWGHTHFLFDAILAAAERANPRMYAVHRPYHAQDREQPASRTIYDLGRIAALLEQIFDSESLYDFYRERTELGSMWMEISKGDNLSRMIYRVLAYAERRVMLEDLLMEVKAAYPEAYEQLKPYEAGIPEPTNAPAAR